MYLRDYAFLVVVHLYVQKKVPHKHKQMSSAKLPFKWLGTYMVWQGYCHYIVVWKSNNISILYFDVITNAYVTLTTAV